MTQSGQGDEQRQPAAPLAHEGVVLPADGSEPWIPGVSDAQASPAGGRPWGEPWGPQQSAQAGPGAGAQGGPGGWGEATGAGYGGQPQGDPMSGYGGQAQGPQPGYGAQGQGPQAGYDGQVPGGYGAQAQGPQAGYDGQSLPGAGYGGQAPPPQGPPTQAGYSGGPLPPHAPAPDAEYGTQVLPAQSGYGTQVPNAQVPNVLPPHAAVGGDSDVTQFIPPVAPGALPPETPAESTTFLGAHSGGQAPAQGSDADATQYIAPVPPAPAGAPFGIRPGAPEERQPPAEFDSLFRTDAPAAQTPDSTQQLPRFDAPRPAARPPYQQAQPQHAQQQYQQQQYQQQRRQPPYEPEDFDSEPRSRRSSRLPVVVAVVVGCAVLGLGVSALMFSGGDDAKDDPGTGTNVAAGSPAPKVSPKAADDPAKAQAEALDKLLADSNNSRSAVIRSVENIKQCQNLDQAATDLHGAAEQRRGLVTRLQGLTVDKLPDHADLTSSLTRAWQASASADDHYASWAQQVKGKKGCKGGKARNTGQTALANRASGDATRAKKEASGLWNTIAAKYGLTERRSDQL